MRALLLANSCVAIGNISVLLLIGTSYCHTNDAYVPRILYVLGAWLISIYKTSTDKKSISSTLAGMKIGFNGNCLRTNDTLRLYVLFMFSVLFKKKSNKCVQLLTGFGRWVSQANVSNLRQTIIFVAQETEKHLKAVNLYKKVCTYQIRHCSPSVLNVK